MDALRAPNFSGISKDYVSHPDNTKLEMQAVPASRASNLASIREAVSRDSKVRFAVISDVHHYPTGRLPSEIARWKLSPHALRNVAAFNQALHSGAYRFGVSLGDSIEDSVDHDHRQVTDRRNIRAVVDSIDAPIPMHYTIGNHDTVNNSAEDVARITGRPPYYSFNHGPFHFIVLHSVADNADPTNTTIPPDQLQWLASDLAEHTHRPTAVFLHHSLSERSVEGNHWFEPNPKQAFVKNRQEVRDIFKSAGNVFLVMNGHLHDNDIWRDDEDGTIYFTLHSATENIGNETPSDAWADVQLSETGVNITVLGNAPKKNEYAFPDRIGGLMQKTGSA